MDQKRKNICNQVQTEKNRTDRPDYIISRKKRTEQNRTDQNRTEEK